MIIDVLLSSCARPDVLDVSVKSFLDKVKTHKHSFRWVILEDYVEDSDRREQGKLWIDKNKNLFDEIHIADKKIGMGWHWQGIVKFCKSAYHIHMEDDQEFIRDINIDPIIDTLIKNQNILEIMLRRIPDQDKDKNMQHYKSPPEVLINNLPLTKTYFMSDSIGFYNTNLVRQVIDKAGWQSQLHECGVLTPISNKLGFEKYTLDHNRAIHYNHVGGKLGYKKGAWKL